MTQQLAVLPGTAAACVFLLMNIFPHDVHCAIAAVVIQIHSPVPFCSLLVPPCAFLPLSCQMICSSGFCRHSFICVFSRGRSSVAYLPVAFPHVRLIAFVVTFCLSVQSSAVKSSM